MKQPIVIIGTGEMAGVFARGFLKLGHPVYPINRDTDMLASVTQIPSPAMVLVAVGEKDLHPVLEQIPGMWQNKLALLQNELLPRDWQRYSFDQPTVISVWFEKKKGQDAKVLIPSPVYGQHAALMHDALASIDIPARVLNSLNELEYELVRKNVYILTTNISGLEAGGTVSELWREHQSLAKAVASDVIQLQEYLTGNKQDTDRLQQGMLEAFDGDPDHKCMGRSAPARLQRALELAADAELELSALRNIQHKA